MEFEDMRLNMMVEQFPQAGWMDGSIVFCAEETEHRISQVSLAFEDNHLAWLSESGFQLYLIELLDRFIEYRGAHGITPAREGMVRLGDGMITIEWLEYGSTHLTNSKFQVKEGK